MLPPETMVVVAVISTALSVFYCLRAKKYKKQLDEYKSHLNNASANLSKPANSTPIAKITNNNPNGGGS